VPGKCFCEGEAHLTKTNDTDSFIEKFLETTGADSFVVVVSHGMKQKYIGKKGFRGRERLEEVCDRAGFSGQELPKKIFS